MSELILLCVIFIPIIYIELCKEIEQEVIIL